MLNESVEIDIVTWMQGLGDWLEWPMKLFTFLGFPVVYLFLVPLLYWVIDSRLATRVAVFLFTGGLINDVAKISFRSPRPFWVSPEVQTFGQASGAFGMPSGHSQVAAPAWGYVVAAIGRSWAVAAGVVVALLIAVSRIYLGVHSLSQVVIGLVLGGLILWGMLRYEQSVVDRYLRLSLFGRLLAVAGVVAAAALVGLAVTALGDSWVVPSEWAANYAAQAGDAEPLDPVRDTGFGLSLGSLAGSLVGVTLQAHFIGWRCGGSVVQRLVRIPVGAVAMSVPAAIVSAVFAALGVDSETGAGEEVFGFALTFALFFGIFFVAPAVFSRIQDRGRTR